MPVGTGRILSFCRSAAVLDPFDPADLRLAARATLVSRHEDLAALEQEHAMRLRTVADRLHERFVKPLALDRLLSSVLEVCDQAGCRKCFPSFAPARVRRRRCRCFR